MVLLLPMLRGAPGLRLLLARVRYGTRRVAAELVDLLLGEGSAQRRVEWYDANGATYAPRQLVRPGPTPCDHPDRTHYSKLPSIRTALNCNHIIDYDAENQNVYDLCGFKNLALQSR